LETILLALISVTLIAAVAGPIIVYVRLRAENKAAVEQLIGRIERSMGASVKLLEVREYYVEMTDHFKKMLDEALRAGDRFRQDQARRLQERLERLKARTLDNTVRMLTPGQDNPPRKRRRRRTGRRRNPGPRPPEGPGGAPAKES
jgi:hypothetical protein